MNGDKQIEEMAKDLLNVSKMVSNIIMEETHEFVSQRHKYNSLKDFHEAHKKGRNVMEAEFLTELGYRKASDIAREIFEEIDRMIYRLLNDKHYIVGDMCYEVAELKKKYAEDGK